MHLFPSHLFVPDKNTVIQVNNINYGNTHEMQKSFCPASHKFLSRISQMGYLSRSLLACLLALISIPSLISLGQYAFSSARMVVFLKSMVWPVEW